MKTALLQITSSDDPSDNLKMVRALMAKAAAQGAQFILTPEVTNCVSNSTTRQREVLQHEEDDQTLAGLRDQAAELGVWLLIGSLGIKTHDADGRFANRSYMIDPQGQIVARYDKIHMFDVQVSESETFRESKNYRPGDRAVIADTDFGKVGLTICYDIRFPHLFAALAQGGARILSVPAAFSPVTGKAHWESLLRARAIENGAWVLAPAQTGEHPKTRGKTRYTHGHSMVVAPWGEVIIDAGTDPGIHIFDLDDSSVTEARRRVPSLTHLRAFDGP
ncbi:MULTISPECIES: carbon-nitrogen hydrolase family protein [unclassified Ruegeria]|uniref:carbon-nitrogen hydrolase family protein n=1 Tax=unclassified Ruegeria TaxID=2625375 RepID=UPI001ADA0521|nr:MULTISPECIES: carbon-nitrogen hydrolase family protein [unclassified Ruegeria]MBO9411797.1 carbon-nitrogen hydrolase family protein [Ruegeria sp. R8_1]MBO9415642.1 carbon-nitrogen hydrolase family protein [Ruegeria sp. R8_2]